MSLSSGWYCLMGEEFASRGIKGLGVGELRSGDDESGEGTAGEN
jgi:hypothetical protein